MPRVDFDPELKKESVFDYPRLKLDQGERARIVVVEKQPIMEHVHTLQVPVLENGEVQYELVERKSGKQERVPKMEFQGRVLCPGDLETLKAKGADPANCPACNAAQSTQALNAPQRRFVMHVFKYSTMPGSFSIAMPFSGSLVAWDFTDMVYNRLVDLRGEWGDLRVKDLILGPCSNKMFQKFDIGVAERCEWIAEGQESPRVQYLTEVLKSNQSPELERILGRQEPLDALTESVEQVVEAFREAFATNDGPATAADQTTRAEVDQLLGAIETGEPPAAPQAAPAAAAPVVSPTPTPPAEAPPAAPTSLLDGLEVPAQPEAGAAPPAGEVVDFDKLLGMGEEETAPAAGA